MNGHYGHWKSGQGPSQSGFLFMNGMLEDCALLDYSDAGRWHDYMCNSLFHRFGYICEYNINNCPPNLQRTKYLSVYKASCLQIVPLFKTWKDARKYCQHNHGDLVTITNFDKEVFVMSQLRSQNRHQKTWIGATDQVSEGNWKWVTGMSKLSHASYGVLTWS
ncbi:hypothetical protein KUTeg_002375 [Tegillarca granosa]|uniref:C-type lectin domain-containing protein n=1 Tax=Tegillarca granosa TaxID=220873 RepID=A0ABQ9FYL8_TEGGR|nr:hypothetical protein KUTeg_002375 [Tegillarca granosa]